MKPNHRLDPLFIERAGELGEQDKSSWVWGKTFRYSMLTCNGFSFLHYNCPGTSLHFGRKITSKIGVRMKTCWVDELPYVSMPNVCSIRDEFEFVSGVDRPQQGEFWWKCERHGAALTRAGVSWNSFSLFVGHAPCSSYLVFPLVSELKILCPFANGLLITSQVKSYWAAPHSA